MSLKALAQRVLQGNQQGNFRETESFLTVQQAPENQETEETEFPDLHRLIGETLAEIDGAGRPWTGWRQSLTAEHCRRLKEAERDIDRACIANDRAGVVAGLEKYRKLTIDHKESTKYESL